MFSRIKKEILFKLFNPLVGVSPFDRKRVENLIFYANYSRLKFLLLFILCFSISMIISDYIYIERWKESALFRIFISADFLVLLFSIVGTYLFFVIKMPSIQFQKIMVTFYLVIGALWIGLISGLDYEQNGITFILGVFLLGGLFLLSNKLHILMLLIMYAIYLAVHYLQEIAHHDTFTEFFIIPATLILIWYFGRNMYMNRISSIQTELNLESYANNLQELVDQGTKELKAKNESFIREIESKELLHNQLLSSQELFKKLLLQSADAIVIFNSMGEIIQWNKKTEKYTGIPEQKAIGKIYWDILQAPIEHQSESDILKKEITQFAQQFMNLSSEPKTIKLRHWIIAIDGQKRFVETKIFPIILHKRRLIGAISRNISQQLEYEKHLKFAREKAEKANRDKTDFLANVSHDLRSPLNSISGFSQILDIKPNLTKEKQKRYLKIIYENSHYLLQLINSLIDLSKLQSGGIGLENEVFKISEFMKKLESIVFSEKTLRSPDININRTCEDSSLTIKTDYTKLLQIYINIVSNAIKFTRKGSVNFGCIIKNETIYGYVEDTGIGMNDTELSKIFERFYSSKSTINKTGKGIGLAIVKGYIDLLQGQVSVKSERGVGTRFDFSIPITIVENPAVEALSSLPIMGKKVLIVDENKETEEFFTELLTGYGLLTHVVESSEQDLDAMVNPSPDIILIDIISNNKECVHTLKWLQQKYPNTPIIGYTGQSETDLIADIFSMVSVIIYKPINVQILLQKLAHYLN